MLPFPTSPPTSRNIAVELIDEVEGKGDYRGR